MNDDASAKREARWFFVVVCRSALCNSAKMEARILSYLIDRFDQVLHSFQDGSVDVGDIHCSVLEEVHQTPAQPCRQACYEGGCG